MRAWMLLPICCLAVSGCAFWHTEPELPTENTVARGQLDIHTDFSLPRNHRLLSELAARRDDVSRALALPVSDEPIHVYLFESPRRYKTFMRRNYPDFPERRAFFVETDTRLIVYAYWGDRVAEDLRHEVTHGYLHSMVGDLPLWLDEGLAEYFEVPRGRDGMNRPHVRLLLGRLAENSWTPDPARLARLETMQQMTQLDYAEAWAWVHFLLNTTPERRRLLQTHLARLRKERSADPLDAALRRLEPRPEAAMVRHVESLASLRSTTP